MFPLFQGMNFSILATWVVFCITTEACRYKTDYLVQIETGNLLERVYINSQQKTPPLIPCNRVSNPYIIYLLFQVITQNMHFSITKYLNK